MVTAVRNSPRTAPALPRSGHILSDPATARCRHCC
jgi:hypothetical protein